MPVPAPPSVRLTTWLVLALAALMLVGCSGAPTPPDPCTGADCEEAPDDLEGALNALGVDTAPSDRVAPDGEALPDDYSPLGASASFGDPDEFSDESGQNATDELFMIGVRHDLAVPPGEASRLTLIELEGVQIGGDGAPDPGRAIPLHALDEGANDWVDATARYQTLRDATAGDLDGDGFEEIVVAYVDTSSADRRLVVKVIDDAAAGYAESGNAVADGDGVLDVAVVAGDFDGDGHAQIVVGVATADGAELLFLREDGSGYSVDEDRTRRYAFRFGPEDEGDAVFASFELTSGNLDYDNSEELGVVLNEVFRRNFGSDDATARYFLYDDAAADFAPLGEGDVRGTSGSTRVARVADLSFGDVDGDGVDEVVLGGLEVFGERCDGPGDAFVTVIDDAERNLADLGSSFFSAKEGFGNCPAYNPWEFEFLHVNAFDLDGDGIDEFHANQIVFEDLADDGTFRRLETPEAFDDAFLEDGQAAGAELNATNVAVATGDVTGDGRENLVVNTAWNDDVRIWGLSAVAEVGFAELSRVASSSGPSLLTPVNLDTDGPLLKYSEGEYQLVFTEPVIVAAMAAAPCADGIGQNLGACSVSFGESESSTVDASVTVSVRAGIHTGVSTKADVPLVGEVGTDFKKTVTLSASFSAGASYTVETSRVFTSGALEDAVVFTTIPYDRYTYTIASHPDPELVGGTVVVSLPRTPIILKVERGFYNRNVTEGNVRIGSNVFDHSAGDLSSYPSAGRKDQLLGRYGGLENGPISVGEGGGSSGLGIDVSTAVSAGGSLGIDVERSTEVTAGPLMSGFSVGYGVEASLSLTSGESTSYSVTVGDLSPETFAANQYSYGIFTYVQELEDQAFEVINFWVE